MRHSICRFALILAVHWCAGCAHHSPPLELAAVGPTTSARRTLFQDGRGLLEVHSATESKNDGGVLYQLHTSYTVHNAGGRRVRSVINHIGPTDGSPTPVELPAGRYLVRAPSMRYGLLTVPVVISPNRLTQVYLDGTDWPNAQGLGEEELVRLPDGRVIGRRAPSPPPATNAPARSQP